MQLASTIRSNRPSHSWCHSVLFSQQGYVVGLTPNSLGSGLEIGDQIIRIDGALPDFADTTGIGFANFEIAHRPGDVLQLDVVGASGARSINLTCADAGQIADAWASLGDALGAGSWSDCEQRASQLDRLMGPTATTASIRRKCFELAVWPLETAYEVNALTNLYYEENRRIVDAAPYSPGGLDAVRPDLLTAISEMSAAGRTDLAQDLQSRLARAEYKRSSPPSDAAVRGVERLDPEALYRQARESVVLIVPLDSSGKPQGVGSGFFVDDGSAIVSNYHVIEGAASVLARTGDGRVLKIDNVLAADDDYDLALLESPEVGRPLQLQILDPTIGAQVLAIGNPSGLEGTISDGIVSGVRSDEALTLYQITAPISPGSSGGPVLNERGEVIGVSSFFLREAQAVNFAVPSKYVASLLHKRSRLALRELSAGTARSDRSFRHSEGSVLAGSWVGLLEQGDGGVSPTYYYLMQIFEEKSQVVGYSALVLPDASAYGIMLLVGSIFDGRLEFQETTIVDQVRPAAGFWCMKHGTLTYDRNRQTLSGRWNAPGCAPGTIHLSRSPDER